MYLLNISIDLRIYNEVYVCKCTVNVCVLYGRVSVLSGGCKMTKRQKEQNTESRYCSAGGREQMNCCGKHIQHTGILNMRSE